MKKLHLIANAHLDPIWLWEWEEGAAAAISTFRSAASLCEEYDYIFCHNEVTLYQWIAEYEPQLFDQIKKLIAEGKWHVMGGWYLQPDCNLPFGESIIRQALVGKEYFLKHFQQYPKTAINVDPFGHSVGLVQILKKCGFDNYLYCRPLKHEQQIDDDGFIWKGLDGSEVKCLRVEDSYNNLLGKADQKIKDYLERNAEKDLGLVMWGVGNHGGGPSRMDLEKIGSLMRESDTEIIHSTPDAYFEDRTDYPVTISESLYPSMVGCYTSQVRVKQKHRELENLYYTTERMCAAAELLGYMAYPAEDLDNAMKDLLSAEFHDILPGSSVPSGENAGLRMMEHGLEILSRLRMRAFFALSAGQKAARENEYPILVFNPHPYSITQDIEVEFQLADQNWGEDTTIATVYQEDLPLPTQMIKEESNLKLDWRKRIVFHATLEPFQMNRFDCKVHRIPAKPEMPLINGKYRFDNGSMQAEIDADTGLISWLKVDGKSYLNGEGFLPIVIADTEDPWAMAPEQALNGLGPICGKFTLMDDKRSSEFIGLKAVIPAVHAIEDGDVITKIEAVFEYHDSQLIVHYILNKIINKMEVRYTVFWNEKNKALKLSVPLAFQGDFMGEIMFGQENYPQDGKEIACQKWCGYFNKEQALAISNLGTHGASMKNGNLMITLLRSPCYSGHKILNRDILSSDRYTPRCDQGERKFAFDLMFGESTTVRRTISREAQAFNEAPFAVNLFPHGAGEKHKPLLELEDDTVQLIAFKKSCTDGYILRLFNNNPSETETVVRMSLFHLEQRLRFGKFEVKTLRLKNGTLQECEQMEI